MKKFLLIIIMLLVIVPINIGAKTLGDLKRELAAKESEYQESKNKQSLTQSEINNTKSNINSINDQKVSIDNEIVELGNEIERLNQEIIDKEEEVKKIVNYYQVANGESAYLEYMFEAADFTDFIYRTAISEQLSKYNKELVNEYNQTIEDNEKKKIELADKKVELAAKEKELNNELDKLNNDLSDIFDASLSIEEEIKVLKEYVDVYQNTYKCKDNEDIETCGRNQLPPGTAFFRPTESGRVSANFGYYSPFGYTMFHYGIDIASTGHGAPVYASAAGKVAAVVYRAKCGGNMVYIHHNINGQTYTTAYFHLSHINVKVGDIVTTNTQIGGVGGNKNYESWDTCSTGTHLHFQVAYGLYLQDYSSYSTFCSKSFNARNVVNFPGLGVNFSNRTTKY